MDACASQVGDCPRSAERGAPGLHCRSRLRRRPRRHRGQRAQAVANAEAVERLERTFGIGWEQSAQSLVIGSPALVTAVNWIYIWGHWPVIIAAATFLYVSRPTHYRVFRNAIITSGLIGFVFFYKVPTAPPRLLGIGLMDTVLERLPRLPRAAAAVADEPVRGDAEPPLRLEPRSSGSSSSPPSLASPCACSPSRCRWRWGSRWLPPRTTSCSTSRSAWWSSRRARRRRRAGAAPRCGRQRKPRDAGIRTIGARRATATLSRSELAHR